MKKLFSLFVAMMAAFSLSAATVYDWSGNVGVTILGQGGKTTVSTVKIHGNQDEVSAVKFEKSYVLADGHYMAIKPAEGAFKAGDVISFSGAINNSGARDAKYAMVQFYAADGATRLFQGDTVVNGQTMEDDLIVESFTLEADQDSILLGRYGTTNMFVTMLSVARADAPAHTYTVAGSSTDLFGTAWDPSNTANDMALVEGLYTWEKTDLTLAAGSIGFKVCEDHAWTTAYPAQDYQLNIPEAGIYTITITFNAESKEVNAVATKTGSAVVVPSIAMHGNFLGSWADTENFTAAEDNATASLTLTIAAGDYEFGMRIGGAGNWTANGVEFTRENPSAEVVAGSGNLKLAADEAGEYTFTWTYETNTLAITFPTKASETPKYYMKHNFEGGEEWTWKEMSLMPAEESGDDVTYILENVIFRGSGVNINTKAEDEGAMWVPAENIVAYDGNLNPATLGAGDKVVFMFVPELVSVHEYKYGLSAIIVEKADPIVPPTPEEHTYTVAGSSADLFGTAWDPTNAANDMVLVEGLYTWKKENLIMAAGELKFKVCEDHAWTNSWPAQDYSLAIPEAGVYTITITFNAESKEVNAEALKTGDAVVIPSVAMHGNFLGSWADTENFTVAEDNATASLTLTIAAGDYEFGMRIGGAGNWTANGAEFTRENPSAEVVAGSGNLKLAADAAGEYTFTWSYATNTLAITFPAQEEGIEETIAAGKAAKVLRDGHILILKGEKTFDVTGAIVR